MALHEAWEAGLRAVGGQHLGCDRLEVRQRLGFSAWFVDSSMRVGPQGGARTAGIAIEAWRRCSGSTALNFSSRWVLATALGCSEGTLARGATCWDVGDLPALRAEQRSLV